MNEEIKSEVTYTIEDFERHHVFLRNRNIFLKYLGLFPLVIFIPILLFFYILNPSKFINGLAQPQNFLVYFVVFLIIVIQWFLGRNKMSYFQKRSLLKQVNATPSLSKPQIIIFDDEGMYGENQFANGKLNWNAMVEVTETEDNFYLFRSPTFAQFVPKRFFTNEQIGQIKDLAKRHLGEKAKF